jgi:hypothetical protein
MKINHEFVRSWIRWVSISLFVAAVLYKFKRIVDTGKVDDGGEEDNELSEGAQKSPATYENDSPETVEPTSEQDNED